MRDSEEKSARVGLGRAIEVRRVHLGLKRKDLAERAQLSYPYISELEKGGKEPSAKALRQIADALELGVAELVALGEQYRDGAPPEPLASIDDDIRTASYFAGSPYSAPEGRPLPRPVPANDLEELVRVAVFEELSRFRRDELPGIVAREVERALADRSLRSREA